MPSETLALTDVPELCDLLLKLGKVHLHIASRSMVPALRPGDEIVVEPVPIEGLRTGDLLLFKHQGQLICHRLVEVADDVLVTRGDATGSAAERTPRDQVVGRVVKIRKRTVWVGLRETLRGALLPSLLRWLARLQALPIYRVLMRSMVAPALSYHLGLAQGARWYEWQELRKGRGSRLLPRSERHHLLIAKRGKSLVGTCSLVYRNSAWQCEDLQLRLRYRGLGLESDLRRVARRLNLGVKRQASAAARPVESPVEKEKTRWEE